MSTDSNSGLPKQAPSNVPFEEIRDVAAPVRFKSYAVAWADRFTFANDVLGIPGPGSQSTTISPYQHPDRPDLYAYKISLEPLGPEMLVDGVPCYEKACITVIFANPAFGPNNPG
jgi:hypothetical protein